MGSGSFSRKARLRFPSGGGKCAVHPGPRLARGQLRRAPPSARPVDAANVRVQADARDEAIAEVAVEAISVGENRREKRGRRNYLFEISEAAGCPMKLFANITRENASGLL